MLKGARILIVTSVNLSANPRSLKEVRSLVAADADVTVIKFTFDNWSNENEQRIEEELKNVKWIRISATRKPYLPWLASTLASASSAYMLKVFKSSNRLKAYSLDKRSYLLHKTLNRLKPEYDIIIAHNPGTFWAVSNFATANNIPFAVDIEDYHAGEQGHEVNETLRSLMNSVLREAVYISAASPLILQRIIDDIDIDKPAFVLNNVFQLSMQPAFKDLDTVEPLKLIWFSQYVGLNRGVQDIIQALNLIDSFPVHLTLMGNCDEQTASALKNLLSNSKHTLHFKKPCSEAELLETVSEHHIGLALEPAFSINNDLALSNKILTYLLAGNAIIVSDTKAQELFINTYPQVGKVYKKGAHEELATVLSRLSNDADHLYQLRRAAYQLAKAELNWEREQYIFLKHVAANIHNAA